jgi:hypothetical protein
VEGTVLRPDEAAHDAAEVFHQLANFAVLAFIEGNAIPGIGAAALILFLFDIGAAIADAVDRHALADLIHLAIG